MVSFTKAHRPCESHYTLFLAKLPLNFDSLFQFTSSGNLSHHGDIVSIATMPNITPTANATPRGAPPIRKMPNTIPALNSSIPKTGRDSQNPLTTNLVTFHPDTKTESALRRFQKITRPQMKTRAIPRCLDVRTMATVNI